MRIDSVKDPEPGPADGTVPREVPILSHEAPPAPRGEASPSQLAVLLAFAGAAAAGLALLLWPFLPALVTACVLGLILAPVHRLLTKRVGAPAAATVTTVLGLLGLVLPLFAIGRSALLELDRLADWLASDGQAVVQSIPELRPAIDDWIARVGIEGLEVGATIATWMQGAPGFLMGRAFGLLAGVGGLAVQAGIMAFTLFFLLRDRGMVLAVVHALIPFDEGRTDELLARARDVVSAVVYGSLLVAAVQGVLGGVAFAVLGLPAPAVWGILMGVASLVPMLGPGVIWLPTALVLLFTGSLVPGLALLAVGILVISTVDNVIRAVFVSAHAGVHPLVVFLGVLGGIVIFGTVGVFVGPVLLAEALLVLEMARAALYPDGETTKPLGVGK